MQCLEIFVNININNIILFSKKSRLQQLLVLLFSCQSCSVKSLKYFTIKNSMSSVNFNFYFTITLIHLSLCQINTSIWKRHIRFYIYSIFTWPSSWPSSFLSERNHGKILSKIAISESLLSCPKLRRFGIGLPFDFWTLSFSFFFRWIKFFLKSRSPEGFTIGFSLKEIKYLFRLVCLLILFIDFMKNDYNFWRTKILLDRYYNVALFIYE